MRTDRPRQATLFGISHIKGIVHAHRDASDFSEQPTDVMPWTKGSFSVDDETTFAFVVGWWNKQTMGEKVAFNADGSVSGSAALAAIARHVPAGPGTPVYLQLACADAFAKDELLNLGPYDFAPRWDFSLPGAPAAPGRCPVRLRDVEAFVEATIRNVLASCLACQALLPDTPLHYVFPPPPVASETFILARAEAAAQRHPVYVERYELLRTHGVRPFAIRHKLIGLANARLREALARHGIGHVDPPSDCLAPSGALEERFALDMHHGNDDYNCRLLAAITASMARHAVAA